MPAGDVVLGPAGLWVVQSGVCPLWAPLPSSPVGSPAGECLKGSHIRVCPAVVSTSHLSDCFWGQGALWVKNWPRRPWGEGEPGSSGGRGAGDGSLRGTRAHVLAPLSSWGLFLGSLKCTSELRTTSEDRELPVKQTQVLAHPLSQTKDFTSHPLPHGNIKAMGTRGPPGGPSPSARTRANEADPGSENCRNFPGRHAAQTQRAPGIPAAESWPAEGRGGPGLRLVQIPALLRTSLPPQCARLQSQDGHLRRGADVQLIGG